MTVAVQNMRVVYTGNGVTTNFPANFSALDDGDVEVYLYEIATEDLDLISGANYNINGVPGDTFSIDYPLVGSPIASTHKLIIQRVVDLLQPSTFSNSAGFDPATLTLRLDEQVRMIQQVADAVDRAVKVDISGTADPDDFTADLAAAVAAAAVSASSASGSAASASSSASDAQTAQTAAELAETHAETAEANAEAAQAAAEAALVAIEGREALLVDDFGADPTGTSSSSSAIADAIAACVLQGKKALRFRPGGIYKLTYNGVSQDSSSILLDGVSDVALLGARTQIIIDNSTPSHPSGFVLLDSEKIHIQGFDLDYADFPFTQGTCVTASGGNNDITLDTDFPVGTSFEAIIEWSDDGSIPLRRSYHDTSTPSAWTLQSGRTYRNTTISNSNFTVGKRYTLIPDKFGSNAFKCLDTAGITVKDCRVFAAKGMAYWSHGCTDQDIDLKVMPRPNSGAMVSATADGIHASQCRGFLKVKGDVSHTHDDGYNLGSSEYVNLTSVAGNDFEGTVTNTIYWRVGDTIGFYDADQQLLGTSTLTAFSQVGLDIDATVASMPGGVSAASFAANHTTQPVLSGTLMGHSIAAKGAVIEAQRGNIAVVDFRKVMFQGLRARPYFATFLEGLPSRALEIGYLLCEECVQDINGGDAYTSVEISSKNFAGSAFSAAGAIVAPVINGGIIRDTDGGGVLLAGVTRGSLKNIHFENIARAPTTPGTTYDSFAIALENCADPLIDGCSSPVAQTIKGASVTGLKLGFNPGLAVSGLTIAALSNAADMIGALGLTGLSYTLPTSFTPTLTFATPGNLSVTYSTQFGSYIAIGKLVIAQITLVTSAFTHTTASGDFRIAGLPLRAANSGQSGRGGAVQWGGITKANYTDMAMTAEANSFFCTLRASGSGQSPATVGVADVPSGGSVSVRATVVYFAD